MHLFKTPLTVRCITHTERRRNCRRFPVHHKLQNSNVLDI